MPSTACKLSLCTVNTCLTVDAQTTKQWRKSVSGSGYEDLSSVLILSQLSWEHRIQVLEAEWLVS